MSRPMLSPPRPGIFLHPNRIAATQSSNDRLKHCPTVGQSRQRTLVYAKR